MGRAILAVIVSYVVMFLLFFAGFTCAYLILGADQAFKPGSYHVSNRWLALSFALHIVVGLIGGFLCAAIAKGGKAPLALAIVAVVIGLLLGIPAIMAQRNMPSTPRTHDVPNLEAMQKVRQPIWAPIALPIVAGIGILIGGKLKRRES